MSKFTRIALSSTAAVALFAALPANAAPMGAKLEALKNAAPAATESVQYRRGRNVAIGLGALGAGIVIGSAIANSNRGYYYDQPYGYYEQPYGYYEQPAYGYGYGYGNTGNGFGYGRDVTGGNN